MFTEGGHYHPHLGLPRGEGGANRTAPVAQIFDLIQNFGLVLILKVEVVKTFALSKLYYVAQVLPLPSKFRARIESSVSKFIFRGRHERLMLSELENDCEQGGLGLPNISIKADSLLLKQTLRMLSLPNEDSFRHLGYWLGAFLTDNFPELLDLGPVSQVMSPRFPLHQYMLDTLEYGMASQEFEKNNLSTVTTKSF